jgi:hypothetical protein
MLGCLAVDRTPSRLCRRNRSGSRGDCDRFASFGFFACLRSGTYRNKAGNDHHRVQMTLRNTTATRSLCMVHVVILHGRVYRTPRAAALRHPFETGLRPVLAGTGSPRLLRITAAGKLRAARTIALPASMVVLLTLVSHGGNRHSPVVVDLKQRHIT